MKTKWVTGTILVSGLCMAGLAVAGETKKPAKEGQEQSAEKPGVPNEAEISKMFEGMLKGQKGGDKPAQGMADMFGKMGQQKNTEAAPEGSTPRGGKIRQGQEGRMGPQMIPGGKAGAKMGGGARNPKHQQQEDPEEESDPTMTRTPPEHASPPPEPQDAGPNKSGFRVRRGTNPNPSAPSDTTVEPAAPPRGEGSERDPGRMGKSEEKGSKSNGKRVPPAGTRNSKGGDRQDNTDSREE